MCGRLNVIDNPTTQWIFTTLGLKFTAETNINLRPTQIVSTIVNVNGSLQQLESSWGIKPNWSKKLLINARGETVSTTKTFKHAFRTQRCVVPCAGWYEWRAESELIKGSSKARAKHKYSFTHIDNIPFLMGGIWFSSDDVSQLVTLTTHPNDRCAKIHNRMPVLILPEQLDLWLNGSEEDVTPMIEPVDGDTILIEKRIENSN